METDIQIAQKAKSLPIEKVAAKIGLTRADLELYGDDKAKIKYEAIHRIQKTKRGGKLILITATTPTPAGEGKTTTAIGLAQALCRLGKNAIVCLREPSLGPVFGIKGGAAGGGYSQVLPMESINLHFTGDLHAVTAANNLISAVIDNHLQQGNELEIDPRRILWQRALDMNDRALRNIVVGLGGKAHGVPREDHFDITVASEIMAVLCLAEDIADLKKRIERIVVALNDEGRPITVADLKIAGAAAALLKDALKPNLVQTLENTPAFVHGGPFANIAHGCNSLIATRLALKLGDYVVTEAGFGADLGAEKFFDIKCRLGGFKPAAAVVVATVRALKHHGRGNLKSGLPNLGKHLENVKKFGLSPIAAINHFPEDTKEEVETIIRYCQDLKVEVALSQVWEKGGEGGLDLAEKVLTAVQKPSKFHYLYEEKLSAPEKIKKIATEIYGANGVVFTDAAKKQLERYESWRFANVPICIAKTPLSLSDNPKLLGRPKDFKITVRSVRLSAGAGFLIALAGEIMTMPGLPKRPAAEAIDIDSKGKITGLF